MLRGAFYISASKDDLGGMGGSLAFKMPREVDYTLAWPLVAAGSEERLLDMFCKGQASIYDVDKDGESLLHVGIQL
jgi:hypothetical protein